MLGCSGRFSTFFQQSNLDLIIYIYIGWRLGWRRTACSGGLSGAARRGVAGSGKEAASPGRRSCWGMAELCSSCRFAVHCAGRRLAHGRLCPDASRTRHKHLRMARAAKRSALSSTASQHQSRRSAATRRHCADGEGDSVRRWRGGDSEGEIAQGDQTRRDTRL